MSKTHPLYCSFCGKTDTEVGHLIAGPTVFICDECVSLCIDVLLERGVPLSHLVHVDHVQETFP